MGTTVALPSIRLREGVKQVITETFGSDVSQLPSVQPAHDVQPSDAKASLDKCIAMLLTNVQRLITHDGFGLGGFTMPRTLCSPRGWKYFDRDLAAGFDAATGRTMC
jgi:hypothetical protein